jgi:hypothetical protein
MRATVDVHDGELQFGLLRNGAKLPMGHFEPSLSRNRSSAVSTNALIESRRALAYCSARSHRDSSAGRM